MYTTEIKPATIPVITSAGNSSILEMPPISVAKILSIPKKNLEIKYAIIDETKIGANEARDWCLKITSLEKISPAIGAPNPEEIAAATPAPK